MASLDLQNASLGFSDSSVHYSTDALNHPQNIDLNPLFASLKTVAVPAKAIPAKTLTSHAQKTISKPVTLSGIGLHSGKTMNLTMVPAAAGSGIRFIRTDIMDKNGAVHTDQSVIQAKYDLVTDTQLCTKLTNAHGISVATVEHLMSAIYALGIDNVTLEIDGPEVPIMDGSATCFMEAIQSAGLLDLAKKRKSLEIIREVRVEKNDGAYAMLLPPQPGEEGQFIIDLHIEYPAKAIGKQHLRIAIHPDSFMESIAKARTFCMKKDIDYMRSLNLISGGSLDNAIVVDGEHIVNPEGLRFQDEFVRHKLLDCVGDMALSGVTLIGELRASCTGHDLNNRLLRSAFSDMSNFK